MVLRTLLSLLLLAGGTTLAVTSLASGAASENKQAMATSAQGLLDMLESVSFLPPEQYRQKIADERAAHTFSLGLQQLPQNMDESTDPRRGIIAADIAAYSDVLAAIALESKQDGEVLWGRIQGMAYERKAHRWIYQQLQSFGMEDVR